MSDSPSPSPTKLEQWLSEPRRWWAFVGTLVVLGWALRSNALQVGWMGDDYMQLAMLDGQYPGQRAAWDLYHFISPDPGEFERHLRQGSMPWWSWSKLHGGVFRPLSSMLLWVDHSLFGPDPRFAHAHALLWWGLMVTSAARLLRHCLPASVAALALCVFAMDDGVTMNIGWVANRCALIAATFGFAAILSHIRAREAGQPGGGWRAALAFGLALCAGEYGLVAFAYLFAWELLGPPSTAARRSPLSMARALAPAAIIAAAFVLVYALGGYGTHGAEEVYAHPLDAPVAYLSHLAHRFPRALAELFASLPAAPGDLSERPLSAAFLRKASALAPASFEGSPLDTAQVFWNHAKLSFASLLGLGALSLTALWRGDGSRTAPSPNRGARWLCAGAVLGLLPVLVAPAHGRLFTLSTLGASAGIAALMVSSIFVVREGRRLRRLAAAALLLILAGIHLVADPSWSRDYMHRFGAYHQRVDASILNMPGLAGTPDDVAAREVIVFAALGQTPAIHGAFALQVHERPRPASWHTLSMAPYGLLVKRTSPTQLVISPLRGPWLSTPPELFFRPPTTLLQIDRPIDLGPLKLRVLKLDAAGRPAAISVDFASPLEDPRYVFVSEQEGLRHVPPPALGRSIVVPAPTLSAVAAP